MTRLDEIRDDCATDLAAHAERMAKFTKGWREPKPTGHAVTFIRCDHVAALCTLASAAIEGLEDLSDAEAAAVALLTGEA